MEGIVEPQNISMPIWAVSMLYQGHMQSQSVARGIDSKESEQRNGYLQNVSALVFEQESKGDDFVVLTVRLECSPPELLQR